MIDLVEFIYNKTCYGAISDLPGKVSKEELRTWYSELEIEDYSVQKWNDAVSYLLQKREERLHFETLEEVKDWIIADYVPQKGILHVNMTSVEGRFEQEISLCAKVGEEEFHIRQACQEILQGALAILPELDLTFHANILETLFIGKDENPKTREYAAKQLGILVMKDLYDTAEQKQATYRETRELTDMVLAAMR